ncbi:MAG TPA: DnaB-like helicase C-terminal domain-containing protein [Candidatus Paceibacterota bacterium]
MNKVINSFDKFSGTNLLKNVDLSGYMAEHVEHNVKPASAYRDDLVRRIISRGEGDRNATPMPFNVLRGKFEFRQYELTIWTGYKGHGKSLMISQAFMSAIKRGKRAFIISPEFRPESVLERMLYQFSGTTSPTREHIDSYMDFLLDRMWLYDAQASLKADDVVALCRYAADKLNADHILIDSLMKCGMGPDDYAGQKMFVDKIQSVAHANPLHIHLVAHARKTNDDSKPPRLHDIKGASEIADMAENVLVVWRNKEKEKNPDSKHDEPDAILAVEAQRNADGWIGSVNLNHDPDAQLFVEPGYVNF